jgi:CheY-like chemotaxis protein
VCLCVYVCFVSVCARVSICAQVCAALRESGVTIPIIAMTGNVDPTSVRAFKRSGFDGLLAKPFTQARAHGCAVYVCALSF